MWLLQRNKLVRNGCSIQCYITILITVLTLQCFSHPLVTYSLFRIMICKEMVSIIILIMMHESSHHLQSLCTLCEYFFFPCPPNFTMSLQYLQDPHSSLVQPMHFLHPLFLNVPFTSTFPTSKFDRVNKLL